MSNYTELRDVADITDEEFNALPLVSLGESKEVRYFGKGLTVIKLLPTIYSFTHNRCATVEGSDIPRLDATRTFVKVLKRAGVDHAYLYVGKKFIVGKLMLERPSTLNPEPFVPTDLNAAELSKLPYVAPVEIIIKGFLTGTTKHSMYALEGREVRQDHPWFAGMQFTKEEPLPSPFVRFDYRNPLTDDEGNRLDDKAMCDDMADWFIDVKEAKHNALKAYDVIITFLNKADIVCQDICLFFTTDGKTMYGEVSPDCGRFRHYEHGAVDKDVWRAGGSSEEVLKKWNLMASLITEAYDRNYKG